jgi:hypothetical protein
MAPTIKQGMACQCATKRQTGETGIFLTVA